MRLAWQSAKRRMRHPEMMDVGTILESEDNELIFEINTIHSDFLDRFLALANERLDFVDRTILMEHHLYGRSLKDVANDIDMRELTIYQRNSRLLRKLRDLADELFDEPPQVLMVESIL